MREKLGPLLAFIRAHEAPKGYNQVWGKIRKADLPPRPLVTMTIDEVLAWQDSIDAQYQSEAAGAYQILEDTLRGLKYGLRLSGKELFNEEMQDQLAIELMKNRGLLKYLAGEWTVEKFCNSLALEWASLPVVTPVKRTVKGKTWTVPAGASYYSGDGLNKALMPVKEFKAVVAAAAAPTPSTKPSAKPGVVAAVTAALVAAGGGIALWLAGAKAWLCSLPLISIICGG